MRRLLAAAVLLPLAPLAAQAIKPGQWEVTARVINADLPGAPPAMIAQMKAKPRVARHCVTKAEAAQGLKDLLKAAPSCKVTRYEVRGGRTDAAMSCPSASRAGAALISASAVSTPTSFTITSHTMITQATGKPAVIDATNSGRWTGACGK